MKRTRTAYLFFLASLPALAQSPLDTANEALERESSNSAFAVESNGEETIPAFADEENEDVGPQYLLVPGTPSHDWFQAVADFQLLRSSNPTLDDNSTKQASDLAVATAQFVAQTPDHSLLGGSTSASAGVRYQLFRYGTFDDTDINGVPVDRNDFDGYSFFTHLDWKKDDWRVRLGLRWTGLDNDTEGSLFYEEFVPTWELSRDFFTGPNTRIRLKYDGAYYATESQTFLPQFDDLNDRLAHSLSVSLLHRLNPKLYVEPTARITYADYRGNLYDDREDTTTRLGASLSYFVNDNVQLRLFTGYQKRNSNEAGIVDYENWDLGLGTTLSARF
ncbi:MAG: outer membrane beta-barrel protein [Opitutales bacterium]